MGLTHLPRAQASVLSSALRAYKVYVRGGHIHFRDGSFDRKLEVLVTFLSHQK